MVYAVIDTNVIVASLLTKHHDSATVRVMDAVYSGKVVPILNEEIISEYRDVLHRRRLGLNAEKCDQVRLLMRTTFFISALLALVPFCDRIMI